MRPVILALALAALPAVPSPSFAQSKDSTASSSSGTADSVAAVPRKKKGFLGKVLDAAKDKHLQQGAMLVGCSGLVPGASTALVVSGACAGGGVGGLFTGSGGANDGSAAAHAAGGATPVAAAAPAPVGPPLLSPDDAGYDAPVSPETRSLLEAQIKQAKAAGLPKDMIKSAFATRTDGGGSSMKGLTEGPARTALFSLRGWTHAVAYPEAAQAGAQAQMPSVAGVAPTATASVPAAPPPGGADGLQIQGDLATGTVVVRGIRWTDPVDDATRQMLVSQLPPLATQMNQLGGRFAIVMFGPASKGGKMARVERSAAFTSALAQLGVRLGQDVTLKPPKYVDASETRVEISR